MVVTLPRAGTSRQAERLPILDALRFFAAVSVVVYHMTYRPTERDLFPMLQPFTKFGYLGVDLFFIISGFVIHWSARGRSPMDYVFSRDARLYPSFWIAVIVTSLTMLAIRPQRLQPLWAIGANLTMLPGYFGAESNQVDGVYWTLAIELKFYLLVLAALLFRQIERVERWVWVWLALTAICYVPQVPHALGSLIIFPYSALFIAGCMFYLMWRHGPTASRAAALVICLVLASVSAVRDRQGFMRDLTPDTVWIVVGFLIAAFGVFTAIALRAFGDMRSRLWFVLGSFTYPLYLIHNEVGKAVFALFGSATSEWLRLAAALLVVGAITWGMATFIELRASPALRRLLVRWFREFTGLRASVKAANADSSAAP
jgi:peptidoglycan/LPS O-acetylase OafA/YrhL